MPTPQNHCDNLSAEQENPKETQLHKEEETPI
jgi:hypothetical protein